MVEEKPHHSKSDKEQLERLFQENYGLLVSQAISFRPRTQNQLDDYIQIAAIGMMKACENYDETKSKFSTYAIVCIKNSLNNHIRKENKPRPISSANMDEFKAYLAESLDEVLPTNMGLVEGGILKMKQEGYTYTEIGDLYSLSKQQVQTMLYNLYRKIRKANDI